MLGLCCCIGFSLVAVRGLLKAVASFLMGYGLRDGPPSVAAHGLRACGSQALEHRLSDCGIWASSLCGIWDLPGPGIEPWLSFRCLLHRQADSLPLSHQRPCGNYFIHPFTHSSIQWLLNACSTAGDRNKWKLLPSWRWYSRKQKALNKWHSLGTCMNSLHSHSSHCYFHSEVASLRHPGVGELAGMAAWKQDRDGEHM